MYRLSEPVYINGKDLEAIESVQITGYDSFAPPENDLSSYSVALQDASKSIARNEQRRQIRIRGVVTRSERHQMEETLDTINRYVKQLNVTVNLPLRGSRYDFRDCSYQNMLISNVHGGYCEFEVTMLAADPHSYATTLSTALANTLITSSPQSILVNFQGNTKQLPIITVTINNVEPNVSDRYIQFTNPVTNEFIHISRAWSDSTTLVINSETKRVLVSNAAVDYSGGFLVIDPDILALRYESNFTTTNLNVKIEYYKRFI